jgi:hypothetical protein
MKLFQLKVMTAVLTSLALSANASTAVSKKAKGSPMKKATVAKATTSNVAQSTTTSNSVTATAAQEQPKQQKKLSTLIAVSRSNSLYDKKDGSEQASWDFTFSTRYRWTNEYSTGLILEGFNDIKDETQSDFSRLQLNLRRHGMNTKYVGFTGNLNWGLPVSKAQNLATLQSSLGVGIRGDLKPEILFSDRLSTFFAATLTRNIHEFDTAANGGVNTQYVLSQAVGAGWKLTDKWSLSADLTYIMTESYQGVRRELYTHSQSVGFQQNDFVAYSLSHIFGAPGISIYKPDGRTLEFELTDEDNSFVSGTVTVTF